MSRIHLSKADITEVEERYVLEALRSGWVAPLGPMVDRFEAEIADRVGVRHALALSSGTAALHLALLGVGAGPGKVVLLPSMTFAASANAVLYTGAEPVFVDSQLSDANVDVGLMIEAVDDLRAHGRDLAAVMTVDLFGRCADYTRLVPALRERGVPLVEDAAEALGATHRGLPAGSFGDVSALSFNGNKIMTTSGGGMLLSDDRSIVDRARYLSTQARQPAPWYEHTEMGYNYRMSNILAALGLAQLSRLDAMLKQRREHREYYASTVGRIKGLRLLGRSTGESNLENQDAEDNCWLTCLVSDPNRVNASPREVIDYLKSHEIEARYLWKPLHLQPLFAGSKAYRGYASQQLFENGITLPSGSELKSTDVRRVGESICAIYSTP